MSQALERLLPDILWHLSGDTLFIGENDNNNDDDDNFIIHDGNDMTKEIKNEVQNETEWLSYRCEGLQRDSEAECLYVHNKKKKNNCDISTTLSVDLSGHGKTNNGDNDNSVDSKYNGNVCSAHRWRRCVELWRHLLGSDRLFLALLFHSGSLWAAEWSPSEESIRKQTSVKKRRSWSKALMWFLQICEGSSTGVKGTHNGNNIEDGSNEDIRNINQQIPMEMWEGETHSTLHIHSEDEVEVQRVAMGLLSDWFVLIDRCGKRFARAYYFSCALKIVALVENTTLVEDIPHLHNLIMREPRSASQFTAFSSILCCLLVEEAHQEDSFRLKLPPPFFLLNFNAIGRGSRIGVWLPRTITEGNGHVGLTSINTMHITTKTKTETSSSSTIGKTSRRGGISGSLPHGEFHSCDVCSSGVMLCTSTSTLSTSGRTAGDLMLGVQFLDEAYVQALEVLPLMYDCEHESRDQIGIEEKRRSRGKRHGTAEMEASRPRCWFAFGTITQSYVRVDLLHPRSLYAVISSPSSLSPLTVMGGGGGSGGGSRRRGLQQSHEVNVNILPLRRSSRVTAQRDSFATIVFALATTARRLMGCRGIFVLQERETEKKEGDEKSAMCFQNIDRRVQSPLGRGRMCNSYVATGNSSNKYSRPSGNIFFCTTEEELECLIECSLHLFLEALLLCLALSSDVMPQLDAWTVEVMSNAVDLALATKQPVVRHMYAVGYALCLAPQPHQSLLVTVGLFTTFARRQQENSKSNNPYRKNKGSSSDDCGGGGITGWWDVFKACVLKDPVIPGQLCSGTWELVERVERSLCTAPHVRLNRQQRSLQSPPPSRTTRREQRETTVEDVTKTPTTDVDINTEAVMNTSELALGKDGGAHRHPWLLNLRTRKEQNRPIKKCKNEPNASAAYLPAPRVEVESVQHSQHTHSLKDLVMTLWWSLKQADVEAT